MIFFIVFTFSLKSQVKRAAHWYFGYKAGVDFNSGTAVVDISGQLESIEGCSSISDPLGNLLFYSNGEKIWNKNHLLMSNGSGLLGDQSSAQSSIIVPLPGSTTLYYLLTTNASGLNNGFRYHVIDMNLSSGNGDINSNKNVLLLNSCTEELAATRHCNDIDYWIVTREMIQNSLKFYAYKLSSTGISAPVISQFFVSNPLWNAVGSLTFSQDGNLLAFSSTGTPVYIFNFNKGTGQLSLQSNISVYPNESIYSNALSPDKSKLYVTSWVLFGNCYVSQFDLTASNITASRKNLDSVNFTGGSPNGFGFIGAIRLAPDQKMYVSRWHQKNPYIVNPGTFYSLDSLGIINAPNLSAPACNFQRNGFYLNHQPTMLGLPNFVSNFTSTVLANPQPLPVLSLNNFTTCSGGSVTLTANTTSSAVITYTWLPAGANTSSIVVSPPSTTTYSLIANVNGCDILLTNTVTVTNTFASVNSPTICSGNAATLIANPITSSSLSYSWLPSGSTSSVLVVNPASTSVYTLIATYNNSCSSIITNTVTVVNGPLLSVNAPSVLCGVPATLIATATPSAGVSYSWLPAGPSTNTYVVSPTASSVYSVMATLNGCSKVFSNTVTVIATTNAITDFLYTNAFCKKDTIVFPQTSIGFNTGGIFSSPGLNIDPNTGAIDLSTATAGTHVVNYSLAAANCVSAGNSNANVVILPSPDLILNSNISILPGSSTTLSVTGGPSYTWSPADNLSCINCDNPIASPIENTRYCVTSELNSCISTKCIDITVTCEIGYDHSVPNAFTPNGDGNNDAFCLQGWTDCITNFNVMIFDRWGEKVFESNDPSFCWDGIYKGQLMNAAVFVYVIKANKKNEQINKKGNITLIR